MLLLMFQLDALALLRIIMTNMQANSKKYMGVTELGVASC